MKRKINPHQITLGITLGSMCFLMPIFASMLSYDEMSGLFLFWGGFVYKCFIDYFINRTKYRRLAMCDSLMRPRSPNCPNKPTPPPPPPRPKYSTTPPPRRIIKEDISFEWWNKLRSCHCSVKECDDAFKRLVKVENEKLEQPLPSKNTEPIRSESLRITIIDEAFCGHDIKPVYPTGK